MPDGPRELPAEVEGRRVRRLDLELPGARAGDSPLRFWVLEATDPEHVLESAVAGGGDPYAAIVWPAALAVAAELPGRLRAGERVLDLGTGTGVCALAAATLGARVLALDHDPTALRVVALAAGAQGLELETAAFDLTGEAPLPACELAILADVLYEPELARAAARRAAEVVRGGGRVVVGDPGRLGRATFLRALAGEGLDGVFQERRVVVPGAAEGVGAAVGVGVAWLIG